MAGGVDRDTLFSNYQPVRSRTFAISLLVEFIGATLPLRFRKHVRIIP